MTTRSELVSKKIELAASRLQEPEAGDLGVILSKHAVVGGLNSGATIEDRHRRRLKTLTELLDLRLHLERETPIAEEDLASWYTDLVGGLNDIIDRNRGRLVDGLDGDLARFLGGRFSASWRAAMIQSIETLRTAFESAVEVARLDDFHFHDCRHHFASWFVMRGGSLQALKEILGHADLKMTLRYAHLAPEHLRGEVAKTERTRIAPPEPSLGDTDESSAQASAQEVVG